MTTILNKPGLIATGTNSLSKAGQIGKRYCCGRPPEDDQEEIAPGTLHNLPADELLANESIMGGTLCASHIQTATYRTRDGKAFFKFEYFQIGDYIEIDIVSMPDFGHRDHSQIHRIPSERGHQICLAEAPKSISACNTIVKDWSELVWRYILTGITIDNQIRKRAINKKNKGKTIKSTFLNWILN